MTVEKIKLHTFRRCPFAIRVRMTLHEMGIPDLVSYEEIEEDLSHPSEDLIKLHPEGEGKVPVLIHSGFSMEKRDVVLSESAIITEYLEETFASRSKTASGTETKSEVKFKELSPHALMPSEPWKRAQVRLLTFWCNDVFKKDLDRYKYELPNLDETERTSLFKRLESHFEKIEILLREPKSKPFLLGQQLSLADIHLFPFFRQLQRATPYFEKFESFPELRKWIEGMSQRPSFVRAMQKR